MNLQLTSQLFRLGMYWRIFYGLMRFSLAMLTLFFVGKPLNAVLQNLLNSELAEDPNDALVSLLSHFISTHTLEITAFVPIYLIFWGIIDVGMAMLLLKKQLWAFPAGLLLMGTFSLYALGRLLTTHSIVLAVMIVIDLTIMYLVWREYRLLRRGNPAA